MPTLRCRFAALPAIFSLALCGMCVTGLHAQREQCDQGIVRLQGVNGQLTVCHAIAERDPKLAAQLDQITQSLSQQQGQMNRLLKSINGVGNTLDLAKQVQILQSLVQKLGSSDAAMARAGHLADGLEEVQAQLASLLAQPASQVLVDSKMRGPLGDSIAQLDVVEARAELDDIRTELHKIDETTGKTFNDTQAMRRAMDAQMHPEHVLPPDEGKLYVQMTPLLQSLAQFQSRWAQADLAVMEQQRQAARSIAAPPPEATIDALEKARAPILAQYNTELVPQINTWRGQVIRRMPALSATPTFISATNQVELDAGLQRLRLLLHRYIEADPTPIPALVRQGNELQASVDSLGYKMIGARAQANFEQIRRNLEARPKPQFLTESTYDESVDGPLRKEFEVELGSKLRAWQLLATRVLPTFHSVDFSQVKTATELQRAQVTFNQEFMRVYNKLHEDVQAAIDVSR